MTAQEYYTGVHGAVTYAGATLAVAEFSFEITRSIASHARSGKWSDLNVPGKVSCKGKLKRIQTNGDLLMAALNATPATGTATTLLATSTVLNAADWYQAMDDTTPGTASRIKLTLQTKAITVAGTITLIGTDALSNPISEVIEIGVSAIGSTWTSVNTFLTVEGMVCHDIDSTDDLGTFLVQSIAGDSTVNVGEPKSFALIGAVTDGSNHITVTLANVTFNKAQFNFTDADEILEDDMEFFVKDPDADIAVTGADA